MSLPTFLLVEVRAAFRLSARQHAASRRCPFGTTTYRFARSPAKTSFPIPIPRKTQSDASKLKTSQSKETSKGQDHGSTQVVPRERQVGALDTGRNVEVPTRVLPKADIAPNVKLSPLQRLHIEHMTRHPPPKRPQKPYKERLLIYHAGHATITGLVFVRVLSIFAAAFVTFIWVPSYYSYGTPWYYLLPVWVGSFIPIGAVHIFTRSFVTEAFLRLPITARASAQAAMTYARNLPRDATLQLRFYRWTGLPGSTDVKIADTLPATSKLRPVNFKVEGRYVDKGTWLKRNPTDFFLRSKTAGGRAAQETIPGLWELVYKRLTGVATGTVPKWKS